MTVKDSLYCLILSLWIYGTVAQRETTTVDTRVGTFTGYIYKVNALGRTLSTRRFLGIPYAEPPIGNLRFEKPVKKSKLTEPLDVSQFAPSCAQQSVGTTGSRDPKTAAKGSISEDCLYLNIFTPFNGNETSSENDRSVMIYIHGGGFVVGSPVLQVADIFSAYGNVIVVTIAYRLSIWGFLSTGDHNLPGNYGLFDQQMAIQWVYNNIGAFGGNPESISLFGNSAGGASVVFQSLHPGNDGLIKRGIAQSGSITNPWVYNPNPLKSTRRLGQLVGCPMEDTKELSDCLRSVSTDDLGKALNDKRNEFVRFPMEFVTCVDGDFLSESPYDLLLGDSKTAQKYQTAMSKLDFMTGVVSSEGLMMITSFVGVDDTFGFKIDRAEFENKLVPEIVNVFFDYKDTGIIADLIIGEYTDWSDPDNSSCARDSFIDLSSDYVFNIQSVETAMRHAILSMNNTFMYLYEAFPSQRLLPVPVWSKKPTHIDEMTTLFGYDVDDGYTQWTTPYPPNPPEPWEVELTKAHISMWTNFAKTGDPNTPVDVSNFTKTHWPKYDVTSRKHLIISGQMSVDSIGQRFSARAYNFWNKLLPSVIKELTSEEKIKQSKNDYCKRDSECEP